jgi:hypothetical protein
MLVKHVLNVGVIGLALLIHSQMQRIGATSHALAAEPDLIGLARSAEGVTALGAVSSSSPPRLRSSHEVLGRAQRTWLGAPSRWTDGAANGRPATIEREDVANRKGACHG